MFVSLLSGTNSLTATVFCPCNLGVSPISMFSVTKTVRAVCQYFGVSHPSY